MRDREWSIVTMIVVCEISKYLDSSVLALPRGFSNWILIVSYESELELRIWECNILASLIVLMRCFTCPLNILFPKLLDKQQGALLLSDYGSRLVLMTPVG